MLADWAVREAKVDDKSEGVAWRLKGTKESEEINLKEETVEMTRRKKSEPLEEAEEPKEMKKRSAEELEWRN